MAMKPEPGELQGIVIPMVTPLGADERVLPGEVGSLVDFLLAGGANAIFALGTTGECGLLTNRERIRLLEATVRAVAGRAAVLAGVSDTGPARVLDNIASVAETGVDAVVATPPFYYVCTSPAELTEHFLTIADASPLPLFLYDIPHIAKARLTPEIVKELARHPNIIGIKDSTGSLANFLELLPIKRERPGFRLFVGAECMLPTAVFFGGDGGVPGIGNIAPRRCADLYEAAVRNDRDACGRLMRQVLSLCEIYEEGSFTGALKAALEILGVCGATLPAKPFARLSAEQRDRVRRKLESEKLKI